MKRFIIIILIFYLANFLYAQNANSRKAVFLTHSVGSRIWGPNESTTGIPQELEKFNQKIFSSKEKYFSIDKEDWPVNPWDNEWVRWDRIFHNIDTSANIEPFLEDYGIVIIKSCYPSSRIGKWGTADDTVEPGRKTVYNYKWHWRNILKVMEKHPDIFFTIWTNAPQVASQTNDTEAYYSNLFCTWAKDTLVAGLDTVYGKFPKNVFVFDFFHKLTGSDGKLKTEYAASDSDNHPNAAGTELVAPQFVDEIFSAAEQFLSVTPVDFVNFTSQLTDDKVQLNWQTATETNNYGFEIERKAYGLNNINSLWKKLGFVPGFGNSAVTRNYSFIDFSPVFGESSYRLKQMNYDGSVEYSATIDVYFPSDFRYSLKQNYPNPFNPNTKIEYTIPEDTHVKIVLYNILGKEIKILKNSEVKMGRYTLNINFSDLPSGVYIYKMETLKFKDSKKIIYLK